MRRKVGKKGRWKTVKGREEEGRERIRREGEKKVRKEERKCMKK